MTVTSRARAASISCTTQSRGSSSRRRPSSAFASNQFWPISTSITSQLDTAWVSACPKCSPGAMSMSMNSANRSPRRSASRPAAYGASARR
jgi:hypothetical protein